MEKTIEKEIAAVMKGGTRRAEGARSMFLLDYSPQQAQELLDNLHAARYTGSPTEATAESVYTVYSFYKSLSLMIAANYRLQEEGRYWAKADEDHSKKRKH